jgi:hypothetical protein
MKHRGLVAIIALPISFPVGVAEQRSEQPLGSQNAPSLKPIPNRTSTGALCDIRLEPFAKIWSGRALRIMYQPVEKKKAIATHNRGHRPRSAAGRCELAMENH